MYASHVKGKQLTFFVSGKLWGRSLVMGDKETASEWSHILGRAMAGPLKDEQLKLIPSVMTNWSAWLKQHPYTTATMIEPTARQFVSEMLQAGPAEFGLGLVTRGKPRFWGLEQLQRQPIVNDEVEGLPLVVYFNHSTSTPIAWQREVDERLLTFEQHEESIRDTQTQSTWNLDRGIATVGPLKGTQLEAVPAIVSFTRAWKRFHPKSSYWEPAR